MKVVIHFTDGATEAIPVAEGYELPELDEFDAATMPLFTRIEAADGSVVMFPTQNVRMMHLKS